MSSPVFSVIICNYNYGRHLEQCFQGLSRQTWQDYEIVLTDDGSTDGSQEIIARHAAKDSRFKVVYFEKNQGLLIAADNVLKRAVGRYIFSQATDDFTIDDRFFERAAAAFKSHPTCAGFFGIAGLYSAERNQLTGGMGCAPCEGFNSPEECYPAFVRQNLFIPGSASIWRADLIRSEGGYNYALGPQIDFFLNHALACKHGVVFTKTPLTCQRIYDQSTNFGSKGTLWEAATRFAEVERLLREIGRPFPEMEQHWARWRAARMLDAIANTGIKVR